MLSREFLSVNLYILLNLVALSWFRMWVMEYKAPVWQRGDNPAAMEESTVTRLLTFNYIYLLNMWIVLVPEWLCFDWAMGCIPPVTQADLRAGTVLFIWAAILAITLKYRKKIKEHNFLIHFSLSLILSPFILSTNVFVYVGFVIAERNLYLSIAGYSFLLTSGFNRLCGIKAFSQRLSRFFMILLFLMFILRSHIRSCHWRNEMDLFTSGLNVCYYNAKVHYNIAKKLADQNDSEKAMLFYKESLRLQPDYEHALNNLGNLLKSQQKFSEAEMMFKRAVRVSPTFAAAHMNLGIVYAGQGRYAEAEQSYLLALHHRPQYPDCQFNLGNLYIKTRQSGGAEKRYRLAAERGHQLATANLIILLDEQNRMEEAHALILQAHQHFPTNAEFSFQLANSFGKQGMFTQSEANYMKAIGLQNKAIYWSNLGVLYHRWNKIKEAIEAYQTALNIDSTLKNAKVYLKKLLSKM